MFAKEQSGFINTLAQGCGDHAEDVSQVCKYLVFRIRMLLSATQ